MEENKNKCAASVASLVLGIISILSGFFYYIAYPTGILAVIFGAKGIKKTGSGLAKAGLTTGIVGLSLTTLLYIIFISLIILEY